MKLGTLLLRNAAIGLSQLEAALRNQVLYGGRLGTNLVELGFIDLELLSAYLAELSGFPVATPTLLDDVDRSLLDKLGSDDAHRLRAIPLGYVGEAGAVAVAVVEPTNGELLDELATRLGAPVTPYIVPELRALYYLEKHFGLPRRARFVRSARPGTEAPDVAGERRREQPAKGMVMPPAFTLEPRRKRASSQAMGSSPTSTIVLSFEDACDKIDHAGQREDIADALCDYAKGRFDALVVFLVRDGNALGWRGLVAHAITQDIGALSLPLGGVSALQSAHDSGQTFVGPPPSVPHPVESKLWTALGCSPDPAAMIVVPVLVKQRPINLIYAHLAAAAPKQELVQELVDLAARIQTTYLRLIRQARGS
ncbi:MAG TPA: hypothetical protein VFQ53_09045 [Kofleriaceae bacterium]|nr:hypothetical protein [Kofleriaceae bacterium]